MERTLIDNRPPIYLFNIFFFFIIILSTLDKTEIRVRTIINDYFRYSCRSVVPLVRSVLRFFAKILPSVVQYGARVRLKRAKYSPENPKIRSPCNVLGIGTFHTC